MPAWVRASSLIRASISPACSSSRLVGWPSSAARSSAKTSWAYTGCSVHSVPSLSNTAMRSRSGTKSGESGSVTAATNSTIECFAVVSRQLGSSSALIVRLPRLMVTLALIGSSMERRWVVPHITHPLRVISDALSTSVDRGDEVDPDGSGLPGDGAVADQGAGGGIDVAGQGPLVDRDQAGREQV